MFTYVKHTYTATNVTVVIAISDSEGLDAAEMQLKLRDDSPRGEHLTSEKSLQTALSAMKRGEWDAAISAQEWDEFEADWSATIMIERHRSRS